MGDFDEAIEQKQFCMYLQPQMTSDGKMIGAEALVRWQHPKRGLIFPGDFIEIFERTGLIYRLDRFIWELAVQQLAKWQKEGRDELYISVNISTKDFHGRLSDDHISCGTVWHYSIYFEVGDYRDGDYDGKCRRT